MAEADHRQVEIKVLEARGLAMLGRWAFNDSFQVRLSFGDHPTVRSTKMQSNKRSAVSWNEVFTFISNDHMPELILEVYGRSSPIGKVRFIGRTKVSYTELGLNVAPKSGIVTPFTCRLCNDSEQDVGEVDISTEVTSFNNSKQQRVAEEALAHLESPKFPGLPQQMGVNGDTMAPVGDLVTSLLKRMNAFAELMDVISEVHPYAKAAWSILNCARQVVKAQIQQDQELRGLAKQMNSLYERVLQVVRDVKGGPSEIQNRHGAILLRVACQANDCGYFIVDYCKVEKFRARVINSIVSDKQSKIEEYRSAFARLTAELEGSVQDGTHMVVTLVWQDLGDLKADVQVNLLPIVSGVSLVVSDSSPEQCFPGTRVAILDEITDWINGVRSQDQRLLLLHGMAGTGKSSIARTIASRFNKLSRLGASFAFNRRRADPPRVTQLFPHIASLLADLHPAIKEHLANTLGTAKDILASSDLVRQFTDLVVKPLCESGLIGPVIIAIDGIDEADEDIEQVTLLSSLLAAHCGQLPSNVRVLITSRPEPYILNEMQSVLHLSMTSSFQVNMADVGLFVRNQLLSRPLQGIDEECCEKLVETSQGLFQWAATACKVIKPPLPMGHTSRSGYEMVMTSGKGRDESGLLDSLYSDVLRRIGDPDKNPGGYNLLMKVVALLFALMESMSLDAFRQLYKNLEFGEESDVDCTLLYLASIIDGISDRTRHVQPNHTSLRDFFLDPKRSGPFCFASLMPGTHDRVARSSFKIVSTSPRQDTSTLDFDRLWKGRSYDNAYIVSEAHRVQGEMPRHVGYATLYWVMHLSEAPPPEAAFWTVMDTSFFTDDRALLWIEIFCLLVIHRVGAVYRQTPPELSGCMQLLARIMKKPGSSCPSHVCSAADLASTIFRACSFSPYHFFPSDTLLRLGQIHASVAWTVKLQRQPEDGPLVTIGSGFFLRVPTTSHNVILATAHNLLDDDGHPHTDLVVRIPNQVPRRYGALGFSDDQFPVPPADIHVCADFLQWKELEADWAAIRLPRGTTPSENRFLYGLRLGLDAPDTLALGTYGQVSWIRMNNVNGSVDAIPTAVLADPAASGAAVYTFGEGYYVPIARGICNPTYGDGAYTKLTPALSRELGLWLGLASKFNTRLRWLSNLPNRDNLYLYATEGDNIGEDSCWYLKHGSGTSFDVFFMSIDSSGSQSTSLGFGSVLVDALDVHNEDTDDDGRLAYVSSSDYKGDLIVKMTQHADTNQQKARISIVLSHRFYYFHVESTTIGSNHGDSELFKISLQHQWREAKPKSIRYHGLAFTFE